jgi:DnaA N-terminal domain
LSRDEKEAYAQIVRTKLHLVQGKEHDSPQESTAGALPLPLPLPHASKPLPEKDTAPFGASRSNERPELFAETWNRLRGPLPEILKLTDSRARKVRTRQAAGLTLARLEAAVARCASTPFLRGSKGWRATFDWLIDNDTNLVSVLEGKYEDPSECAGVVRGDVPAAAFENLEAWNAALPLLDADAVEVWNAVLELLRPFVPVESFATWLKPTRGAWIRDGLLTVAVPSKEFKYIGEKWDSLIKLELENQGLRGLELCSSAELFERGAGSRKDVLEREPIVV